MYITLRCCGIAAQVTTYVLLGMMLHLRTEIKNKNNKFGITHNLSLREYSRFATKHPTKATANYGPPDWDHMFFMHFVVLRRFLLAVHGF